MKVNNHGDLILYPVKSIKPPATAKKAKLHILQESNTTGNRHEVVSKKKPIYRWKKGDKEYISCQENYIIQHIGGDEEHGTQSVEKGAREVRHEMEYNPWGKELRIVID
jgi:hypothetical protein